MRISVDAQALIAREQATPEAVSQAMLAVTSLRHLPPTKNAGRLAAHTFSPGYSPPGEETQGRLQS